MQGQPLLIFSELGWEAAQLLRFTWTTEPIWFHAGSCPVILHSCLCKASQEGTFLNPWLEPNASLCVCVCVCT